MALDIYRAYHVWTILYTVAIYQLCAAEVEIYRGLQYATVPHRFSPPQPVARVSWRELRGSRSDRFKPSCPQRLPGGYVSKQHLKMAQSENCLYLNIYRPTGPSTTKSPVLVFIQGERFEWSSGHLYDGSQLASYGRLIVITLSYRLGILGFLNADPGRRTASNIGLLDQIAALQWIQDNILVFGGDPGSVTVVGHGSGAACVHWLMTSPSVLPGNKHSRRGFSKSVLSKGQETTTSRKGMKTSYDLLLGVVNEEAFSYFSEEDILYGIETSKKIDILQALVNSTYWHRQSPILATLVNEYTEWERPIQHPIITLHETMEALGDGLVVAPLMLTADLHSGGCFLYAFSHQIRSRHCHQKQRCARGEDLLYLFGVPLVNNSSQTFFSYNFSKADVRLSKAVMTYWANFARTGNSNKGSDPSHNTQKIHKAATETWLPYDTTHKRYLMLDAKPRLKNHYRAHRLSFWLNLVPQLLSDIDGHQFINDSS